MQRNASIHHTLSSFNGTARRLRTLIRVGVLAALAAFLFQTTAQAQELIEVDHEIILKGTDENANTFIPPQDLGAGKAAATTIDISFVGPWWNPARENAVRYAMDLWGAYLTSPVPIRVLAVALPLGPGTLASSTPGGFAVGGPLPLSGTIFPVALAENILGSNLNSGAPDIIIRFNSSPFVTWYTGLDGATPPGSFDLSTVALHEFAHGAGFFSAARLLPPFPFTGAIRVPLGGPLKFIYDQFVETGPGPRVLNQVLFPDPSVPLRNALRGDLGGLHFNGVNTRAATTGPRAPLFSPTPFEDGSSYVHLREAAFPPGNPNSLMTPALAMAEAIHDPGAIAFGMLRDMGWMVNDETAFDYGDAPLAYPTLRAANGARHVMPDGATTLVLGKTIDRDDNGQVGPPAAERDDNDPDGDDEDGILSFNNLIAFSSATSTGWVEVEVTGGDGFLNAWIDFDRDGDFDDSHDQIFDNEPVSAGTQSLLFTIPTGAQTLDPTFARFRLSSIADVSYQGTAPDGEVEDYRITLIDGHNNPANVALLPGEGSDVDVRINNAGILQIRQGGTVIFEVPFNLLQNGLNITGTDDAETLTLHFNNGTPIPTGGLTFDGGLPNLAPGDAVEFVNGTVITTTYAFTNESDGTVDFDGDLLTYLGLEPISDNLSVTNRVFNFGAGAQIITMADDGVPNSLNEIDSDGSEIVIFTNPSNSLTINAGGGNDQVTVDRMDNFFEADLSVFGNGGMDEITLNDVYKNNNEASTVVDGGAADDVISVLASSLPKKNAHSLLGDGGVDIFNLFFDASKEIPDNSGTSLTINGGLPDATFASMDVVNVFANEPGDGVRSLDLVYNSDASSDATLTGLGTENGISLLAVEDVNYVGDDADDDDASVTYTPNLDVVTVEPIDEHAANVFLGGTPFSGVTPPLALSTPGVAGGEVGPDLSFDGLVSSGGLLLLGGDPTTVPGDELHYHGSGYVDVTGTATGRIIGPGVLDVNFVSFENHYTSGLAYVFVTADADAGDGAEDVFTVRMLDDVSGEVIVEVNGVIKHKHLLSEVGAIEIDGSSDDDKLIVDYVDGNPIPVDGLFFNGNGQAPGGGGGDDVVLNNGDFNFITHAFENKKDGSVVFKKGGIETMLTYTGLEPILDNLVANNRVFDFSAADDNISLDYSGTPDYAVISTSGPPTSESVTFLYPNNTLTINGNTGEDDVTVNDLPGFDADVTVNGGIENDVITVNATFGSGAVFAINGDDGDDIVNTFATSGTPIASFTIEGGDGHDRFNIQPDFVEIVIHGGTPTFPDFPGDVLDVDLAGVTDDAISILNGDGAWTFSNREDVTFFSIEALYDVADLSLKKTVSNSMPIVGESVTFTVTVKNDGDTGHALEVSVLDLVPAGLLFESFSGDGSYDDASGIWTVGDVPQNESRSLNLTVKLKASTVITNKAQVIFPAGYDNYPKTASANATITPWEQSTVWRNANREAGTITGLAHLSATGKNVGGTIFAGSDGGGIHRSIDGGENWYPTGAGDIRSANIRELATSAKTNALWAATYQKGAWRSTDLGDSYTQVFDAGDGSDNILSVAINTNNPIGSGAADDGDVFLGTDGDGIFVSSDNGSSWTDISSGLSNFRIMSIFVEPKGAGGNKDRVWVGTYGSGVYYMDYVAGPALSMTWVSANGADPSKLDVKYVHAVAKDGLGNLYAGTTGGIFQSTDNGGSWTLVEDGKTDQWAAPMVVRTFLTYFDGTNHFVWAGTDGEYIYRSMGTASVGGAGTWEQETGFPSLEGTSGLRSRTVYDIFIVDGVLFAATRDYGLHRSDSQGKWWDHVQAEILNPVIQAMTFSLNGSKLFAGTYGWGVLMTDDFDGSSFVNWTRVNNGLDNHWVYAMDVREDGADEFLFAGTWGGGVYRSTDGGESWQFSGLPHGIIHDLAVNDLGTVFATMDRGAIARSVDNGLTWQEIGVATTALWSIGIDPVDPDVMYAGTAGAGIYQTSDGGFTWIRSGLTDRYVFAIEFDITTSPTTIYAATATGVIKSLDGGATWSDQSTGLTVGETRTLAIIPTGTPGEPLMTAGTWGGGVFTYDWTVNAWIRDGLGEAPIVAFAINPISREGFVSTNDGGLFRRQYPSEATSTSSDEADGSAAAELPSAIALDQNYPNPFNPQTTIDFALPSSEQVRLAVFDALGRTIKVLVDGAMPAGRHAVTFDAGELPSGTYFYQLRAGDQVVNKKMVLLK